MTLKPILTAAIAALIAAPVFAMDAKISIDDAYARASSPNARSGAAFLILKNAGDADDRLVAVASDAAERVELHTHISDADGVMRMVEVEDGIEIPAGGVAELMRGGDHVMFMGLTRPFLQGEAVSVTLTFEVAGDVAVEIPVDLDR